MSKQISQETFDEAVLENINEFDMSPDEAVAEAISQFEAQGVCLDSIVKQYRPASIAGDLPIKHRVVELTEQLEVLRSCSGTTEMIDTLTELAACCNESLAQRCLASKTGAYPPLLDTIKSAAYNSLLMDASLKCLSALVNGQPDILNDDGSQMLVKLLSRDESAEEELILILEIIARCCVMHEGNRQRFVAEGLVPVVGDILSQHGKANGRAVKQCCTVYCSLILDDDPRVPFGKAHEHAKLIVSESDAIRTLMGLSANYQESVDILGEIFVTVGRLAVRDEFCQQVLDSNGVKSLLTALQNNNTKASFVRSCLILLKSLCGSDPVKVTVVKEEGAETLIDCLDRHVRNSAVCEVGCAALAALVLRHPALSAAVMECKGAYCLVRVLENHSGSTAVQRQVSMAIRNLVSRSPENCAAFLELGVEPLLRRALDAPGSDSFGYKDEVKAALRDLGCSVHLEELWKGTGRDLVHD